MTTDRRTPASTIELHIDALVLEGFRPTDRHALAEAFSEELVRLLEARARSFVRGASHPTAPPFASDGSVRSIAAGALAGPPDMPPRQFGRALARTLAEALPSFGTEVATPPGRRAARSTRADPSGRDVSARAGRTGDSR